MTLSDCPAGPLFSITSSDSPIHVLGVGLEALLVLLLLILYVSWCWPAGLALCVSTLWMSVLA